MRMQDIKWKLVTMDGWLDWVSLFNAYGTEPDSLHMMHVERDTRIPIGLVDYTKLVSHGLKGKKYFINPKAEAQGATKRTLDNPTCKR